MTAINIIRTAEQLAGFVDAAVRAGWVAMDTEFLRERTYAPELCLIQATNADNADNADNGNDDLTACIDPLAPGLDDLSPLGDLLGNPGVVKIFHSCRQDLEALDTRADFRAGNLYDTQLAAAFCGYGNQVSYAALVEALCGVCLSKSHTRTDWSRRPLSDAQLAYAVDDVKYLPTLRRELDRLLAQKGRAEWHRDECAGAVDPANYRFDPENAWLRLKGIERLNAAAQGCAQKLAAWRERRAQRRNLPRGWILPTPVLLQICRRRPKTPAQLAEVNDINAGTVKHAGREIIALVAESENRDARSACPTLQPLTTGQRRRVREIMALLEDRATQEALSRSLIANRQEVESFVRGQTETQTDTQTDTGLPLFAGWRARLIGDEILARYA